MEAQTKWINEEFLRLALSNGGEDASVTITDYSIKPAVDAGNNYCTQLFRVKVDYCRGNNNASKSLIIKAPLAEGSMAKSVIDDTNLLENEYIMYKEILPEIIAISGQQFGPKTYFCKSEDVLVMDDLTEEGFTVGNRLQQLDRPHCERFLATLAEYHAATVVLHQRNPQLVESNGVHPIYNENMKNQLILFFEKIKRNAFVTTVQKLSGMEDFVETIQSCGDNLQTALLKMFKRRGSVNVLNHGDCWTNNIMFKHAEGGEVSDCKLIDYQVRSYGSPAVDLVYFLFTSAREEVRQEHTNELLQLYCETLNKTLAKLDCNKTLSFQDLQEEMRQVCPYALYVVMQYLPLILNEPDELSEKLKENEENMKSFDINVNPMLRIFLSKTYNDVLPGVCNDLIKLGVIDYLRNINS